MTEADWCFAGAGINIQATATNNHNNISIATPMKLPMSTAY